MTDLFETLDATWPAGETIADQGWLLRRSSGGGNRVTAASLNEGSADILVAEQAMRGWGQNPLFQVREGQNALDQQLADLGYICRDETVIMSANARTVTSGDTGCSTIHCQAPLASMAAIWNEDNIGPDRLAVMGRVQGPRSWVMARRNDRPVGVAFVAAHQGIAMMHSLVVTQKQRRNGIGRHLAFAAANWARENGADTFALAVTTKNTAARNLYQSAGLRVVDKYWYRAAQSE